MDLAPDQSPAVATALADRFRDTIDRTISPGLTVVIRQLPMTDLLLRGVLPNQVLTHVLWDHHPAQAEQSEQQRQQQQFEGYVRVNALGLVGVRLPDGTVAPIKLKVRGEADHDKGEIAPEHLTYLEHYNLYFHLLKEVVPPFASAPFRARRSDPGDAGAVAPSGDGVREESE